MATDPLPGQQCSNCGTTKTPLWRRAPDGTLICNACGLYYRSNNAHRPVNLKRPPNTIAVLSQSGSCRGDGHCNGTGGSAACRGCPAYNNRVVIKKEERPGETVLDTGSLGTSPSGGKGSGDSDSAKATSGDHDESDMAIACFNCGTTITPLWRRDDAGNTICNACGLYYKLHKSHRPVKMKRTTIKRRKRHLNETGTSPGPDNRVEKPKKLPTASPGSGAKRVTSPLSESRLKLTPSRNMYQSQNKDQAHYQAQGELQNQNLLVHRQGPPMHTLSAPLAPGFTPPHGPSHYPPYTFHPYAGLRIPNGPGPVPGPPPPMGFAYATTQNPYMYGGATVPPGPVPGFRTVPPGPVHGAPPGHPGHPPLPGQGSAHMHTTPPFMGQAPNALFPPIKLPSLNLPQDASPSRMPKSPPSLKEEVGKENEGGKNVQLEVKKENDETDKRNESQQSSNEQESKKKTPIPVDFTTAFPKAPIPLPSHGRLSIGGLLNKK